MIARQLKNDKFTDICTALQKNARSAPLCPIYEVDLFFNGEEYTLFLMPAKHRRMYALYALHSVYEKDMGVLNHYVVSDSLVLSALMEMVIFQGVKKAYQ